MTRQTRYQGVREAVQEARHCGTPDQLWDTTIASCVFSDADHALCEAAETEAALERLCAEVVGAQRIYADSEDACTHIVWEEYQNVLDMLVDAGLWRDPAPQEAR